MSWVETDSLSFVARHEEADTGCAQRTLDQLESLRLTLEDRFERVPDEVAVVIHTSSAWLAVAHPYLPLTRGLATPAARRYLAGWTARGELHLLNDRKLDARAAGEDSRRALRRTAERLYAQMVVATNNDALPPPWYPAHLGRYLRWAWLVEGAGQYFSGQVPLFRAAVISRLKERRPATFPPNVRDAAILGGTVFDLLEQRAGPRACELLVARLRKAGPNANLEFAFDEPLDEIRRAWRAHLNEQAAGRQM
jgi:hypothetical protein